MNYVLELEGCVVPKARPRGNNKGTFYTQTSYRLWKEEAIAHLRQQQPPLKLSGVRLDVVLEGKHSRRGDADNIIGSLMDALVQAGILANDNLVCVTGISLELNYNQDNPKTYIAISPA